MATPRHFGAPGGGRTPRQDQAGGSTVKPVIARMWTPAVIDTALIDSTEWSILTDTGTLAECRIVLTDYGGGPLIGWFSGSVVGVAELFADNNINFRVVAEAGGDTVLSAGGDYFNANFMGGVPANFYAPAGPAYTHIRVDAKTRNGGSQGQISLADPDNPCNAVLMVAEIAAFA